MVRGPAGHGGANTDTNTHGMSDSSNREERVQALTCPPLFFHCGEYNGQTARRERKTHSQHLADRFHDTDLFLCIVLLTMINTLWGTFTMGMNDCCT